MAMHSFKDKTVSKQVDVTIEPLRDILEYALEKIRLDEFDEAVLNDFGTTVKSYLSFPDSNFRKTEQLFIVHLNETICKFVQENANHIGSALTLVYKAMSLLQMATFFSLQNNTVVPRYNVSCQMLTEFLFLELYRQNQDWNMVLPLIRSLISQAKKMIEEKPAFCFICCTDLIRACSLFSIDINMNWHLFGELQLLQARSALNGNALDLAMYHCKIAEEKIYNYENSEGFAIWAKALALKEQIPAAIKKAEDAVKYAKEGEEKEKAESYLNELYKKVDEVTHPQTRELDETWLEGTHAHTVETEQRIAKAVEESHIPRKKRSRPKRKQTDSIYISSSSTSCINVNDSVKEIGDIKTWTSERIKHNSELSSASETTTAESLPEDELSRESSFDEDDIDRMLSHQDWSSSSEDEDKFENEPDSTFLDDSDSDDNIEAQNEIDNSEKTWFEQSKEISANNTDIENNPRFCTVSGLNLEEKDVEMFLKNRNQDPKRRQFYKNFIPEEKLQQLLKKEPDKYKRCRIEMESAQKAVCKILDSAGPVNQIEIAGRSKCGQCFNNDEVVVEILFDPKGKAKDRTKMDSSSYGEVVGVLNSHFLKNSQHPILACTSNEVEGWLMKPLCQSIPKIHVVNTVTRTKFPNLVKYRNDIYKLDGTKLKYKGKFNINPALRGQYVFLVVYLGWGNKHVYPLGAVLDVLQCGKDFNSGLRILEMQYKVPSLFPEDVIAKMQTTENTADVNGREDRTKDLVFTIDPSHSKDLDDALSVVRNGNNYIVGVHIADVASVVKKDDAIDKEARRRAVSFYIQNRRTRNMLPEPLSQDICSLVPGEIRPAVSTFFLLDQEGKMVKVPIVKKTIIKSCRKFSYEEVQKIIENGVSSPEDQQLREAILILHDLAQNIRKQRLKDARFMVPFSDPRFFDVEDQSDCPEAHALVEEFMIYTNTSVAKLLAKRFPKCLPLRCQTPPATKEVQNWMIHENKIVDLLVHLQGKKLGYNTISAPDSIKKYAKERTDFIPVQSDIWELILECFKNNSFKLAQKVICTDELHPLQNLAWRHWIRLLDKAEYRCSGVTKNKEEAGHFSLEIQPYIHFTSPIRRYVDLISHRMVHALLSGDDCPYTVEDINEICIHVTEASSRQKQFDHSCKVLTKTERMGKSQMVFLGIVDEVSENGVTLSLPGLRYVPSKCREVRFSLLDLSKMPEMKKDTRTDKDIVICQWKKRLYDVTGCPDQAKYNRSYSQQSELKIVDPNQHTVLVRFHTWANILKEIFAGNETAVQRMTSPLEPTGETDPLSNRQVVTSVTSETGQGYIKNHQCKFSLSIKSGQVIKVQLGASPNNGLLLTQVELVHITNNLSLCHRHMDDPVGILSKYATSSVKKPFYSIEEYKKAWIPIIEMEAALSAVSSELTPIINRVDLTLTKIDVSGKTIYTGSFQLPVSFCYERNIEFGGLPMERLPEVETIEELGNDFQIPHASNDYVCIRCFLPGSSDRVGRSMENGRTWIGHGQIVKAVIKRRADDINEKIPIDSDKDKVTVFFVLNNKSLPPPADLMLMSRITGTVEIICKIQVDRRTQHAIASLKKADDSEEKGKLVRAIVLNRNTPPLPKTRLEIAQQMDSEVKSTQDITLPKNNQNQHKAIKNALKKSFSLIQGPPGTGKTYTGIKLIYLFNEINKTIRAQGDENTQVLFCGPSNKSVDMVARYLKERLGTECPKLIRMYGSNIMQQDYPIPNRNLISRRLMHDLKSDPELRSITLHHIIRERGSFAKDIRMFDDLFALMLKPNKTSEDEAKINRFKQALKTKLSESKHRVNLTITELYSKIVGKAYAEELRSCEVILCTCSVGGNPKVVKNTKIFQCIIDEAAMCPEPLALVPIIATDAKQVVLIGDHKQLRPIIQCSEAAELGMGQSLFERYSLKPSVLTFLNTQYRMHKKICEFPSRQFYDNKLETGSIEKDEDFPLKLWPNPKIPLVFCHVEGVEETLTVSTEEGNEQSKSNMAEADKVVQIYRWLIEKEIGVGSRNIVVLSQYNAQVSILKQKLTEYKNSINNPEGPRYRNLNVSTVVSSQGGEWDYVIFSTVRSLPSYKIEPAPTLGWCKSNLGFITDANQINVALTRARKGLIIVGNKNLLEVDQVWKNLLMSYERKGCLITDPDQFPKFRKRNRQKHQHFPSSDWQKY